MNIIKITLRILVAIMMLFFAAGFYIGARYTDNQIGIDDQRAELGKWEMTMEWYRKQNPKEAKKIEDWKSRNTK